MRLGVLDLLGARVRGDDLLEAPRQKDSKLPRAATAVEGARCGRAKVGQIVHKLRRVARPVDGVIGGAAGEVVLEMGHRSIRNILAMLAVVMREMAEALASLNLIGRRRSPTALTGARLAAGLQDGPFIQRARPNHRSPGRVS